MHDDLIKELEEKLSSYERWLDAEELSAQTRRAYNSRIKGFKSFLAECPRSEHIDRARALREIAQNFHAHLLSSKQAKASSVNASITAVYSYYSFLGEKVPPVNRDWVQKNEPRILTSEEQDRLLLAMACHNSVRDRALVTLLLFTGIRIGECRELKVEDVEMSAHQGRIAVVSRNKRRSIPLNQISRQTLLQWLIERSKKFNLEDSQPLFPNKSGEFMTRAAIDEIVRKAGRSAGLNICAQVLRNTFLSTLLNRGSSVKFVAELGGQAKLEHVRRFRKEKTEHYTSETSLESVFENSWSALENISLSHYS